MTGALNLPAKANGANDLSFGLNIGTAHLGTNSTNDLLGIHSKGNLALRVGGSSSTDGVVVSTSAMYPTDTNIKTLGTSTNKWSTVYATTVYGAVWNDYAEFRKTSELDPGRVVQEKGDGSVERTSKRLISGCSIVSDTFGFAIGETEDCKTPLAVSGRVLAYPLENKEDFIPGCAVCSGPNGTVSIMTREEIKEYPDCIIGYFSENPDYEEWGTGHVKINNRIWIKLR